MTTIVVGCIFGVVAYTDSKEWFTFSDLVHFRLSKISEIPPINDFLISQGWKEPTTLDILDSIFEEVTGSKPRRPAPDTGEAEISGKPEVQQMTRDDGSNIIVISGLVINKTRKVQSKIKVYVSLKDEQGEVVNTKFSYCDVSFTSEELTTMSRDLINYIMTTASGRNQECLEVKPGEKRTFTVVFFDPPEGSLKLSKPQVVGYEPLGD